MHMRCPRIMQKMRSRRRNHKNRRQIQNLLRRQLRPQLPQRQEEKLTTSPNLASAGTNVGGASLCLSTPSKTSTNRPLPPSSIFPSNTASCARFSHRPAPSSQSTAAATAHTVRSSRCRPVMHSLLLTIAYLNPSSPAASLVDNTSSTPPTTALFPVAARP